MYIRRIVKKANLAVVTPESIEDLWTLRRIISQGDIISGETKRVVKEKKEFARPDKGERVRIRISVEVELIRLDSTLERLRISGRILEASEEFIGKGDHHSLIISLGHSIAIKKKKLDAFHIHLLKSASSIDRIVIIAIDRRDAGIGSITGTHLTLLPSINSGLGGKMYSDSKSSFQSYFSQVEQALQTLHQDGVKVVIVGPGDVKRALANFISERNVKMSKCISVVDGIDVTGEDGVYTSLKSQSLQAVMQKTTLAKAEGILHDATNRISKDDERVAFSLKECLLASKTRAIESLLVSSKIFEKGDESQVVEVLNSVEMFGGQTLLVDDSTDVGKRVESMGGVVSLLRYPIPVR